MYRQFNTYSVLNNVVRKLQSTSDEDDLTLRDVYVNLFDIVDANGVKYENIGVYAHFVNRDGSEDNDGMAGCLSVNDTRLLIEYLTLEAELTKAEANGQVHNWLCHVDGVNCDNQITCPADPERLRIYTECCARE